MKRLTDKQIKAKEAVEPSWQVIVMNDPVNLTSYVTLAFRRVFGYELERAKRHMMEVHSEGHSILWSGDREQAENYAYQLNEWQITVRLQKHGKNSDNS